jgi:hypothetical protein
MIAGGERWLVTRIIHAVATRWLWKMSSEQILAGQRLALNWAPRRW